MSAQVSGLTSPCFAQSGRSESGRSESPGSPPEISISLVEQIHIRAVDASSRYRRAEAELIEVLQQVEEHRVFLKRGHSSLFAYVVSELGLGDNAAYALITVARKAREVPALAKELKHGTITLTNARRIASVLTDENQGEWLQKAASLSSRQLEKEVVRVQPMEATRERASYVTPDRVKLELGLSERDMLALRRVQDLVSRSKRRTASLEEAIAELTSEYLRRHDPVEKAKRHQVRQGAGGSRKAVAMGEPSHRSGGKREARSEREADQARPRIEADQARARTEADQARARIEADQARPRTETEQPRTKAAETEHPIATLKTLVARREPVSAAILHQVNLRDQGRCVEILPGGTRCNETRWTEGHHVIPVSQGGLNTVENLVTLCSAHHKRRHLGGCVEESRAPLSDKYQ